MEKNFNIFHGLFETGDYHVIVEKLISLLDLDTLHSLRDHPYITSAKGLGG